MKSSIKVITAVPLLLILGWGGSSWYFAKQSNTAIDELLSNWQQRPSKYIAEVELLDSQQSLFSATHKVLIEPSLPYLYEQLGDFAISIKQQSGPIFFSDDGVSFGRAKWLLSLDSTEIDQEETVEEPPVQLTVLSDFSKQLHLNGSLNEFKGLSWHGDDVSIDGLLDLSNGKYQLNSSAKALTGYVSGRYFELNDAELKLEGQSGLESETDNFTTIDFKVVEGALLNEDSRKNIPLNLSSAASVWKKNDTLDADLKVSFVNTSPLDNKEAHFSLKLREWLLSGVVSYLDKLAESSQLQRQAKWALEEIETPEQQDFYRSLRYQSEQVGRLNWKDIVLPAQAAGRSQVELKVDLNESLEPLGSLELAATAAGSAEKPSLPLAGDLKIVSSQLDEKVVRLLSRWAGRGLLREYESAFEGDITVQGQDFLLNDRRVPFVRLNDELKRVLIDQ